MPAYRSAGRTSSAAGSVISPGRCCAAQPGARSGWASRGRNALRWGWFLGPSGGLFELWRIIVEAGRFSAWQGSKDFLHF